VNESQREGKKEGKLEIVMEKVGRQREACEKVKWEVAVKRRTWEEPTNHSELEELHL
jgi:hypothetical protein